MKVKCVFDNGEAFEGYNMPDGFFESTKYDLLEIDKEYEVMGMILGEGLLSYLIDDSGIIACCPHMLFDVTDNKMGDNWYFKSYSKDNSIYPYQEAVWGYHELCFDGKHYEQLVEMEQEARDIYFKRKKENENLT